MILFSPDAFIKATLRVGSVYKFSFPEHIKIKEPHYFIVVAIEEDEDGFFLICCTTNRERKERIFKAFDRDPSTLICISPDDDNGFTEDTWVDSNEAFPVPIEDFRLILSSRTVNCTGDISYNHYDQIRTGIINSDGSDIPHFLLTHPKDE